MISSDYILHRLVLFLQSQPELGIACLFVFLLRRQLYMSFIALYTVYKLHTSRLLHNIIIMLAQQTNASESRHRSSTTQPRLAQTPYVDG
jgi:ABC-type dipeptide/oligopeptide/nickel transport system permease subunit